ncbi:uncharacterized protein LOC113318345 [Papaver somniferum]|uniref:uncharacterized protein LOC113318345 n=1 Tax=Papaver somniferum TaxID=3469 RepID=UPI000E6FCA21|nr:uncharacterized protein LOC113318345 [Papaver somniferum]XP_026422274.1 uncharacterized protein LOC113318345 [Papaver somniferum]XP_026422275.1 uncharacterized protein LOC113318345 [Papaver somniferum]XP_026422276.1 uncharacterized protein LOC113318345 [Papaver somniferum]
MMVDTRSRKRKVPKKSGTSVSIVGNGIAKETSLLPADNIGTLEKEIIALVETPVSMEEECIVKENAASVENAVNMEESLVADNIVRVEEEGNDANEKAALGETPVSMEEEHSARENAASVETAVNMEEENNVSEKAALVETPVSMEENIVKERTSENPGPVSNPLEGTIVAAQDVTTLEEGIDLSQYFKTDEVFGSRDAVIQWCQEVGRKNNTVLVIKTSKNRLTGKGRSTCTIELGCERGGVYKSHKSKNHTPKTGVKRKRSIGSKKCGCPFSVRGTCKSDNKWSIFVRCGRHNHEVESTTAEDPLIRRLKEEEELLLAQLTTCGVRPKQVLKALKERNKENHSTIRTIYNARAKLRVHEMEGKSVMQQIIKLSTQFHYLEWHKKDEVTDELKNIMWSHPESTLLVKCFPSVLMVDSAYKINRFKLPYFHVVGFSSTGHSFTVAHAFLEEESEENFGWLLTQLKSLFFPDNLPSIFVTLGEPLLVKVIGAVFPGANRLLCTSYIEQDIVSNCKKAFESEDTWNEFYNDWERVWKAKSKEDCEHYYAQFETTWMTRNTSCVTYLRDTWLKHKESFCLAWTQNMKHFGNTIINRLKSEHGPLKKSMASSAGSFFTCWEAMHNMINRQIFQIKSSFEKSLISVLDEHQIPAFEELRNHVSHYALELMRLEVNQSEDLETDVTACKCSFRSTHGIPCAHELMKYTQEGRPVPLSVIDEHWKQLSIVPLLEKKTEFDCLAEVHLLRQRWIKASESERHVVVEMMKELATTWS